MIKDITWEEILPFWELLHPGRNQKKFAKMTFKRELKWDVPEENLNINFFGDFNNNIICGVYSTHMTPNNLLRSRGIVVLSEYRKQGIATRLAKQAIKNCNLLNCDGVWAYPRVGSSLNAHLQAGYKQVSDLHESRYGTNCYVLAS